MKMFKKMFCGGKKPDAGSAPASGQMQLWGACFAEPGSGQARVEGGGNVARQAGGGDGCVGFLGGEVMTSGVHAFEFEIVASRGKAGHHMRIGFADASAAARAGGCGRPVAWGYHPYLGLCCPRDRNVSRCIVVSPSRGSRQSLCCVRSKRT